MFAHAIHRDSSRKDGPFVIINCAAIPESLIESELFGYQSGAFTGAEKGGKPGKFELANRGTVFLDEIGELPMNVQAKFLRVLETQEIDRVGGISTKRINIRVISATNANLEELVKNGKFRMDLYYRLNTFTVKIPPLRERTEDINPLSHHFITKFNQETGLSIKGLSNDALAILMSYHWPGNVRELKSVIEKACLGAKSGLILPEHLTHTDPKPMYDCGNLAELQTVKNAKCNAERDAIIQALESTGGNKKKACMLLDMNRTTFYKRLKEYGLF
jgi:transcriptional regulator with PAS, ATPase and Fis domain